MDSYLVVVSPHQRHRQQYVIQLYVVLANSAAEAIRSIPADAYSKKDGIYTKPQAMKLEAGASYRV